MVADSDTLQGTWSFKALEMDGQKMAPIVYSDATIALSGKTFTSLMSGMTYKGRIELDESKSPKEIDLVFTAGPQKGTRNLGIYKLAAGTWTICLATRGTKRPTTFATKADTGLALEVLERAKPGKKKAAPTTAATGPASASLSPSADERAAAAEPATALEGEWQMIEAVMSGVVFDEATMKWCQRVTRGAHTRVVAGPQTFLNARFSVDDRQQPATIEYVNLSGKDKGKSQSGIVELKDGELRICVAPPGKPRPKAFSSKKGDGVSYTAWRKK
jgi:uncharacterized protein (TIGR03067 family)